MARQSRPGPKLPLDRIERAVEYHLLGYKWGEIELLLHVAHSTLMRWYATPVWKAMAADWQARDTLSGLTRAVLSKALRHEFSKKGPPDTSLAERLYTLARENREDNESDGFRGQGGIVLLPMQNKGLESRPPMQVLMPPRTEQNWPSEGESREQRTECTKRAKGDQQRRRAAGPDE